MTLNEFKAQITHILARNYPNARSIADERAAEEIVEFLRKAAREEKAGQSQCPTDKPS